MKSGRALRILVGLAAVAMVAVMATMLGWSVPRLVELGGAHPFDVRFAGYGHDDAVVLLTRLGPEGRAFYDGVQLRLDTAFPILYFVALSALLAAILGRAGVACPWRAIVAVVVVGVPTALDFAENAGIRDMLRLAPDAVTAEMVARASFWTTTKWQAAGFGVAVALVGSAVALARHRKVPST